MFTSLSERPGRSARSRKWSSCSTRSIAGVQRCATCWRSKRVLKSRSKSAASGSGRMRRAIGMTSYDEGNLTCAQFRYLSLWLSTSANPREACAGGRQAPLDDRLILLGAHLLGQLEAVQVRAARDGAQLEPRAELLPDRCDRVKVATKGGGRFARMRMLFVVTRPPLSGRSLEALSVELV